MAKTEVKIALRFVQGMTPYQAGEVAGFAEDEARKILDAGFAVRVGEDNPNPQQELRLEPEGAKALEEPPAHKALLEAPARKAGRSRFFGGSKE